MKTNVSSSNLLSSSCTNRINKITLLRPSSRQRRLRNGCREQQGEHPRTTRRHTRHACGSGSTTTAQTAPSSTSWGQPSPTAPHQHTTTLRQPTAPTAESCTQFQEMNQSCTIWSDSDSTKTDQQLEKNELKQCSNGRPRVTHFPHERLNVCGSAEQYHVVFGNSFIMSTSTHPCAWRR